MDCVQLNGRRVGSLKMIAPVASVTLTLDVVSTTLQSQLACVKVSVLVPLTASDVISSVKVTFFPPGLLTAGNLASS